MRKEYRFLLNAMLVNKTDSEIDMINDFLSEDLDWFEIAGQLFNHRLGGYFYHNLSYEQQRKIPKELNGALRLLVVAQKYEMERTIDDIRPLLISLEESNVRYAGLKGLMYNADFYELGSRRSNDIDLLVYEEDISKVDNILRQFGYTQGYITNNELREATKKEKLIQRMNYHDLIKYVKKTEWGKVAIDINFLFDTKNNVIDEEIFNHGTVIYNGSYYSVRGLPLYTNLAHLCVHFFREATNTIWTKYNRDVALYKVVDIMNCIRFHREELVADDWIDIITKLNLQDKCYYTFYILNQFYDDPIVNYIESALRPEDISFLDDITVEGENRVIKRTESFLESAFNHIRQRG
ncbi:MULTISPECIES: nucleotidyltransferase family protein [Paenibacillus]|uniref:nucleotidyltransferase family protein n=1 Tax=Paenibacillus TaxID=44249 RepID=UPI00096CB6AC|nr:nucleotidyltransferase family protein [Paenibacillus odorifer]OMD17291.1 hypothetical protein BJP50_16215 [Paenibacillus odorifer]